MGAWHTRTGFCDGIGPIGKRGHLVRVAVQIEVPQAVTKGNYLSGILALRRPAKYRKGAYCRHCEIFGGP
jgi:hypothetical protein